MSTVQKGKSENELTETVMGILDGIARFLMWAGLAATVVSLGFLIYYAVVLSSGAAGSAATNATNLIEIFRKVLTGGMLALFLGSAFIFWGETWLGIVQILLAGGCIFAPTLFPALLGSSGTGAAGTALLGMQRAGMGAGIIAVGVLIVDSFVKVQTRFKQGIKADQLKYGKGIKEEVDRQNVFMGKCYQLPYCRKFVRERCPIYHARRSCWREKVGCMCEEEVIKGAMENRAIPKDAVAAARYIPVNNKITLGQKMERCRQCVIYNEHQKHKYRLMLPITILVFGGVMAAGWKQMMLAMNDFVAVVQKMISTATFEKAGHVVVPQFFQQVMLVCVALIVFAYALKLLEFLIFKLKV